MIMNYNEWFHQYHKYLTGERDGVETFNDTKWKYINDRYQTLIDLSSQLISKQPYGVVGNYTGFRQLTELMEQSNYTFEDLNASLVETYRMSLQNAMSRMLVNTHVTIAAYWNYDKKHVYHDKNGHYYVIDVPFDQMHFGDRDRFIRDKLHKMYETESRHFIPSDEFLDDEISKTIGFTILCTTNGFLSDDWAIGVDDKGFHFRIGWKRAEDVKFGIYKLDCSRVLNCTIPVKQFNQNKTIPLNLFGVNDIQNWIGCKCIVQFSDAALRKDIQICPNFGTITPSGLVISNLQKKSSDDLQLYKSSTIRVRAYVIQYLHEIPNIYPAIDYYDMMGSQFVYDAHGNHITNDDGGYIRSQETEVVEMTTFCTPPISLDHKSTDAFYVIRDCYDMIQSMRGLNPKVLAIGEACNAPKNVYNEEYVETTIKVPSLEVYNQLMEYYKIYLKCAILTSMIPTGNMQLFESMMDKFLKLAQTNTSYQDVQQNVFDELFGNNFMMFVEKIVSPFAKEPFTTLGTLLTDAPNYFEEEPETRFNRPVAEQCFIALRYNSYEKCWVFDQPDIKHFNGIENTFYVGSELNGDEIYKFFVLYTDTENPRELETSELTFEQCMDFDLFQKEVDKHIGYVRYWHAENHLTKLSELYYQKHGSEAEVNIFSKILKRKLDGEEFLTYPSEMNFEPSDVTSDNIGAGEFDTRAPFALNFLFYTVSMLFDNKDQLLAYFMHMLVEKEFTPRYRDLKVSQIPSTLSTEPINFSIISSAPNTIASGDIANCSFPTTTDVTLYSGIPFPVNSNHEPISYGGNATCYLYNFNQYADNQEHVYLTANGVDPTYYIKYTNVASRNYQRLSYSDDMRLANMISIYLAELYNGMNDLVTNYKSHWNQEGTITSLKRVMEKHATRIQAYITSRGSDFHPYHPSAQTIIDGFTDITQTPLYQALDSLLEEYASLKYYINPTVPDRPYNVINISNAILNIMQKVYDLTGFDHEATRRIRRAYIQLKQIDQPMSLYQYKRWATDLDIDILMHIHDYYSDNPNVLYTKSLFKAYVPMLKTLVQQVPSHADATQAILDSFDTDIFTNYLDTLVGFCDDVIQSYIVTMYAMKPITFSTPVTINQVPAYGCMQISVSDDHVAVPGVTPTTTYYNLYFYPKYEKTASGYQITSLIPICTYSFFDGTDLTADCVIYNGSQQTVTTISNMVVSFQKVSSSADQASTLDLFVNTQSLPLEVQNTHETFDVLADGSILNQRHADLHYEMLAGNRFLPISSFMEDTHPNADKLQGPIDKLYLSCNQLNQYVTEEQSKRNAFTMFFKACQIMHITPVSDLITSILGKYRVGQKIYIATDDGLNVFPAIITSIDHSRARGFLEAKVDEFNTSWFQTQDPSVMHTYLTEAIPCTVLDDNLSNFMNEYAEFMGQPYAIPTTVTLTQNPEKETVETLPGDPLYVSQNSSYVYASLDNIFNGTVPNLDVDHHFVYIGSGAVVQYEGYLTINMINHDFNPFTDPELYPVLRTEPDDHAVWQEEIRVFSSEISNAITVINQLSAKIIGLYTAMQYAHTEAEREALRIQIEDAELKRDYQTAHRNQLESWITQLETPSTWYNVNSYDAAMVYINNGRAHISQTFRVNIRDISYTDDIKIMLYDWEHKTWLNPTDYTITTKIENGVQIDPDVDAMTDDVLTSIELEFDLMFQSKRILVYFVYDTSHDFDDITLNNPNCEVRFRPVLSIPHNDAVENPYDDIRIRKHFDANEAYAAKNMETIPDIPNSKLLKRYERNGKYTSGSTLRFCDLKVKTGNTEYGYANFDVYVKHPLAPNDMPQTHQSVSYSTNITQPIDGFAPGYHVTLVCMQNQDDRRFNGITSDILFDAVTSLDANENPVITIMSTSAEPTENTTYLCYVTDDSKHPMSGGVIRVIANVSESTATSPSGWIKYPNDIVYRIIPTECVFVPKSGVTVNDTTVFYLQNHYNVNHTSDVSVDNSGVDDPFVYYYDLEHEVRYPIGDIRKHALDRLVIDRTENPSVRMIRSNHIGVCRYVAQTFPSDGVIDLTGYIPTPLSRDRYEFWVNGRYVTDPDDIVILSPTTFQLRNMRSLRNLEVIELVDDINDTVLTQKKSVYIDINGRVFGSYTEMMRENANIIGQDVQYTFYQNLHDYMDTFVPECMRKPNNIDIETDILSYLQFDDSSVTSYNELNHIPSINGVSIYHASTKALGFMELPHSEILHQLDKTWKKERLLGLTDVSHFSGYKSIDQESQYLHVRQTTDGFEVYTTGANEYSFTLYISQNQNDTIDSTDTVKIIPMLRSGTIVTLDSSFAGMWLHSTVEKTKAIRI